MNSKVLTLFLLAAGLLLGALLTRSGDLAWMALPFLVYLGIGVLRAPASGDIRLHAARSVEKTVFDGGASIEVSVTVSNQGNAIEQLSLFDPPQPQANITDGQTRQTVALGAGENTVLSYTFRSGRGSFAWEDVQAVASDPFGLVEAGLALHADAEVQVQPVFSKFRPFSLRPQRTLPSAGSIPARVGGSGTDFWGVREYHPGDPLRQLDWRLTARHPRKFFTKEFEQEEIADIGLVLDARQETELRVGDDSLFEHSVRAAASLAEAFLRQGNRVSLLIYQKPIVGLFPGYGKVQLNKIMRALAQITVETNVDLGSLELMPLHAFSSGSLVLILSSLTHNDWRLFPRLRARGYQALLISPDPFEYARRLLPDDPTTQLAGRLARVERHLEISKIRHLWVPVIDWQVSQPLSPLVRHALLHTRVHRQR